MCEDGYDPCESYYYDFSEGQEAGLEQVHDDLRIWLYNAIKTADTPQYRNAYKKVLEALDTGCF